MSTPPGFGTVTPYIFADDAPSFCRFLLDGRGAEEILRHMDGDRIANAQFRLGNATIMVSEAGRGFAAMPASYYLFVADVDAAQQRAINAGATGVSPVRTSLFRIARAVSVTSTATTGGSPSGWWTAATSD